jgi:hypothetical protein
MDINELLKSLNERPASVHPYGISTASWYLKSIADCLAMGDTAPLKAFNLATGDLWAKELSEAQNRLTYCDEQMADPEYITKSIREGTDITSGAVMEYDCILSSKSKDRDRDVVWQKGGLEIDLKMPLLWQHIQVQPIGKHVALLSQDEFVTKSRFAIADTQLGRDAAVLAKFGALRKSHGFRALEASPIETVKGADGRDIVRGWEIKRAACMEGSLVSIPANPDTAILATYQKELDGIATAFSRKLLANDAVKMWAKSVYDKRPIVVQGAELLERSAQLLEKAIEMQTDKAVPATPAESPAEEKGMAGESKPCKRCKSGCGADGKCGSCGYSNEAGKSLADDLDSKSFELSEKLYGMSNPYPAGSFEAITYTLNRNVSKYLQSQLENIGEYDYCTVSATFADSAIVYCSSTKKTYRVLWSLNTEGMPVWTGEPKEVELGISITEKMLNESREEIATKSATAAITKYIADNPTAAPATLTEMARKLAADILTSDGTGGEVKSATEIIRKAVATLEQQTGHENSKVWDSLFVN